MVKAAESFRKAAKLFSIRKGEATPTVNWLRAFFKLSENWLVFLFKNRNFPQILVKLNSPCSNC